jgi:hypothetical protein
MSDGSLMTMTKQALAFKIEAERGEPQLWDPSERNAHQLSEETPVPPPVTGPVSIPL